MTTPAWHYNEALQGGYIKGRIKTPCGIEDQPSEVMSTGPGGWLLNYTTHRDEVTCDWCLIELSKRDEIVTMGKVKEMVTKATTVNIEGAFDIDHVEDRSKLVDLIKAALKEHDGEVDKEWAENEEENDREWHRVNIHTALREHIELPGFRIRFKQLISEAIAAERRQSQVAEEARLVRLINNTLDARDAKKAAERLEINRKSWETIFGSGAFGSGAFGSGLATHPDPRSKPFVNTRVGMVDDERLVPLDIHQMPEKPMRHARKIYTTGAPLCGRIMMKGEMVVQSLGKRQLETVTCPWCKSKMDIAQTDL